jgi:hypothetical protein
MRRESRLLFCRKYPQGLVLAPHCPQAIGFHCQAFAVYFEEAKPDFLCGLVVLALRKKGQDIFILGSIVSGMIAGGRAHDIAHPFFSSAAVS